MLADGECVSVDGTHLGHNLPDRTGNRSSARWNASSRQRQSDDRAGHPRLEAPSRSGTAGPLGCRAEPRPRGLRSAALEPLSQCAVRHAGAAACDHPGHSLTHLLTYLLKHSPTTLTHPLRLLHQSGLGAAACSKWPPWQYPSSAPALHPLRERPRRRLAYLSGSIPSRGEADPLGDEPQPQVLEPAASRVDSSTGL